MLTLRGISKRFAGPDGMVEALQGFSLEVQAGEFVAVCGPSGSGKTTLLLIAGGLLHPDEGEVLVAGQELYRLSGEARARLRAQHIGFVFQQFHLVPYLSVLDNVMAAAVAHGGEGLRQRAVGLVERFGLGERLHHHPAQLSTGERQRTALARALLQRPKLVLADEPTGNLDEANSQVVLDYLRDFAGEGGAVLLVTHDPAATSRAQRMVHLPPARKTP